MSKTEIEIMKELEAYNSVIIECGYVSLSARRNIGSRRVKAAQKLVEKGLIVEVNRHQNIQPANKKNTATIFTTTIIYRKAENNS